MDRDSTGVSIFCPFQYKSHETPVLRPHGLCCSAFPERLIGLMQKRLANIETYDFAAVLALSG